MVWWPVLLLLLVSSVVGCGNDDEPPPAATGPVTTAPEKEPAAVLQIDVLGGAEDASRTIVCPGAHECRRLARTKLSEFDAVPRSAVCTQIYGGDATATISGRLRGREIYAEFALNDGCEIGRWQRFSWLLGEPPGAGAGPAPPPPVAGGGEG